MSMGVLIVLWWLVIAESTVVSGENCSNSSLETCTRDLLTSAADFPNVNWTEIQQIRENNCSLCSECRGASSQNSVTYSTTKGWIAWQPTTIGYRRLNICPFAHGKEAYAFRDCLMINETISWAQENTSECPLSPFSMAIEIFYNETHLRKWYTQCNYCSYILTSLSNVFKIRRDYPNDQVLSVDHLRMMNICIDWITNCSSYSSLPTDAIWNASDLLLNWYFVSYWELHTGVRFLNNLRWIFRTNKNSGQEHVFNGSNIYVYERADGGNINFQFPVHLDDQINVTVNAVAPEGTVISNIGSFLIKTFKIPSDIVKSFELEIPRMPAVLADEFWVAGPLFYIQFQAQSRQSTLVEVTFQDRYLSWLTLVTTTTKEFELKCVRMSSDQEKQSNSPYENPVPKQKWTSAGCNTTRINAAVLCRCFSPEFVTVFLTPFLNDSDAQNLTSNQSIISSRQQPPQSSTVAPTTLLPILPTRSSSKPPNEPDMSVFFGFPYDRGIYITGEVLKAVSLTCLVITVIAYAIYRKARKGATTNILLNLCVSLIVLIIVLYIAAYEANSDVGCRVLNALRYYLALVSLLWNAVEAHNMYRMLVKVFHAETSHFVLTAGIFAWGLPMLAVGIGFAINIEAFDGSGSYADCTFRCALKKETRLYGWIPLMSIIILHNLIVFAMVLKVICRTNTLRVSGETQGSSAGQRLCGALTMLVLLGFPWIISVFGLIDTQDLSEFGAIDIQNSSEYLLQKACSGILVIFVGLQGLFIFHFHCVRNRTIRDLTRKHINTSLLTLRGATSRNGVNSQNHSNAITESTQDAQNSTSTSSV